MARIAPVLSKWSVPYFFLVLGYFLGKKIDTGRTTTVIERISIMFLVASVLLLPMAIARDGLTETWSSLMQSGLYNGSFFHLWYLNSLLWGLLVFRLLDRPTGASSCPV